MDINGMERVWHGSHRKPDARNWSMYSAVYSAVTLLILVFAVVVTYPH
jgi:hypothetical protein